jgi:predicted dithiol-disulfide oxidoreductase (DUF899 family)
MRGGAMAERRVVTHEEWLAERKQLLQREQELNRLSEELTDEYKAMPWVPVEKEYSLATEGGTKTLAELFDGRTQLLVYHMMFGPEWTAACPGCSNLVDEFDLELLHLNHNDVTLVVVAHAPLEKVRAYRRRMEWTVPCVSSYGSDFNFDFAVSFTEQQRREGAEYNFEPVDFSKVVEELARNPVIVKSAASCGTDLDDYVSSEGPGLSVFALEDGVVYRTYSVYAPDAMLMLGWEELLWRTPKGEDEVKTIRRRDEYDDAGASE